MAVNQATGYNRTTNEPIDALFLNSGSVYSSTAEVNAKVNSVVRYRGATFNVNGELYWYKDGISDNDLVLFNDFATGSLEGTSSWAINSIDSELLDGRDSTTYASTASNYFLGNQTVDGYVKLIPVNTGTPNETGSYLFTSGSDNELYFLQNSGVGGERIAKLDWLQGNLYTGLLHGGLITAPTGSTTFSIGAGSGIIVDLNASLTKDPDPTVKYVKWDTISNISLTYLNSNIQTFVGLDENANVVQQTGAFNNGQYNTVITIGTVLHQNKTTINGSITYPNVAYGYKQRTYDFVRAFGPLKLSGYTILTTGSLGLNIGSGTAFADGRNYQINPNMPSYVSDSGTTVSKIFRYYQSGSQFIEDTNNGLGYTTIDPTKYNPDGSGSLQTIPGMGANKEWTIQRVFWYPNSATKGIVVYYGTAAYPTATDAIANLPYELFLEVENTKQNAVYLGALILKNTANWSDSTTYRILPGGIFRNVGGSGGGGNAITQLLSDLADVKITGPTNGQPLIYDSVQAKWVNGPVETLATVTARGATTSTAVVLNGGFTASSGTVNGTLIVSPTGDATLSLRANSGANTARVLFNNGTTSVWALFKDSTVSDFRLYNYSLSAFAMTVAVGTNNVTFNNNITAASIIRSGGTSAQFLKADGSVDSNTYVNLSRFVMHEVPSGTVDGVNKVFTIANTPLVGKLIVFLNGIKLEAGSGNDYTISSNTITFETGMTPQIGDKVAVTYIY